MSEWCVCHFHHFHAQVPPRGAASDDQPESRVTAGRWGDVAAAAGEAEASAEDGVRTEVEAEAAVAVEASGMSSVCAERVRRASKM